MARNRLCYSCGKEPCECLPSITIGGKYSIRYDPKKNDSPGLIERHGRSWASWATIAGHSNMLLALFYDLLESKRRIAAAEAYIADLEAHEGAEGFSESTAELKQKWKETK